MPFPANRETSGRSRKVSVGLPGMPICHVGLALMELGPPPAATRSIPVPESPLTIAAVQVFSVPTTALKAQESFQVVSGTYPFAEVVAAPAAFQNCVAGFATE